MMKLIGWVLSVVLVVGACLVVADNKTKPNTRVVCVVFDLTVVAYILCSIYLQG